MARSSWLESPHAFEALSGLWGERLIAEPPRRLAVERGGVAAAETALDLRHLGTERVARDLVEVSTRHFRGGCGARGRVASTPRGRRGSCCCLP